MNGRATESNGLLLPGIDGSNPLAFLAALGTLRTLDDAHRTKPDYWSSGTVQLSWRVANGAWRPVIHAPGEFDRRTLVDVLHERLCGRAQRNRHFLLGKNLSVPPSKFAEHAKNAALSGDRRWADYVASFGSEVLRHEKLDRIDYTELCFVSGSGHQHYLKTMSKLVDAVQRCHLESALFDAWDYKDQRLSLRWDPADAKEHAYQWTAPGDEITQTMWGANLLAAEGSTLFTCFPTRRGKGTIGFKGRGNGAIFTWPIWTSALSVAVARSLLARSDLFTPKNALASIGIAIVYRSFKIKIGEGANFKWSFSPAWALSRS